MAAVLDGACASGLFVGSSNNVTSGEGTSGTSPSCNYSGQRPYSSEATAALATAITLMMLLTIFGNIMVIIAVLTSRSLRGPQNLFLVSLAAADILVATLIIPFSLANELMGYWYFKSVWCEIYLALDVLFCTSSIVHLCAISLDRYLSVSRAVKYSAQRTPGRIKAAILVVWLISAIISFPPLLSMNKNGKGGVEESKDEDGLPKCRLNEERWYILYSTVGSFFAPCLIMVLVYIRIYQIAKKHARCPPGEAKKKAMPNMHLPQGQAQQNGNDVDGTKGTAQKVTTLRPPHLAVRSATCPQSKLNTGSSGLLHPPSPSPAPTPTTTPSITPGHTPALSPTYLAKGHQEDSSKVKMDNIMKKPDNNNGESPSSGSDTERPGTDQELHPSLASTQKSRDMIATSKGTILAAQKVATEGTPNTRRKAMVIREKRLTFVLAVVIGVFVVCWFPFFFSYSLQAICPDTCQVPKSLFTFFFWIGYCNSSLNPIIYTVFNKDFRRAFKKILCRNRKDTFF